jgi:hypothetical protein
VIYFPVFHSFEIKLVCCMQFWRCAGAKLLPTGDAPRRRNVALSPISDNFSVLMYTGSGQHLATFLLGHFSTVGAALHIDKGLIITTLIRV